MPPLPPLLRKRDKHPAPCQRVKSQFNIPQGHHCLQWTGRECWVPSIPSANHKRSSKACCLRVGFGLTHLELWVLLLMDQHHLLQFSAIDFLLSAEGYHFILHVSRYGILNPTAERCKEEKLRRFKAESKIRECVRERRKAACSVFSTRAYTYCYNFVLNPTFKL